MNTATPQGHRSEPGLRFYLCREIDHQKPDPATNHSQSGITADEHQREELIASQPEDELVSHGTVDDERDGHRQVQQREAVGIEDATSLRHRCHLVKGEEEQDQPKHGVDRLDREFGGSEEQREQRNMAGYRERPERTEIPPVFERDQTEGDNDEENGFFVDVPAEEKGCVAAQSNGTDEGFPVWPTPELDQWQLYGNQRCGFMMGAGGNDVLTNWKRNVSANVCSLVTSGRIANEVSPTRPRVTLVRAS